jgi:hypoxanthine-guanine phosphoribosyltransferase
VVLPLALGKIRSSALGLLEVNKKNISSRNTMSVIEDILNSGLILFLPFNFIKTRQVRSISLRNLPR